MYLIDTDIVSELRKVAAGRADPNVLRWFETVPDNHLYLSVISIMELELGIARLDRRDPVQAGLLRRWLRDRVEPAFSHGIMPINSEIASRCALLHVPDPRSERDAWIAATALVHDLTVVTRNVADFAGTGVEIIDPFAS